MREVPIYRDLVGSGGGEPPIRHTPTRGGRAFGHGVSAPRVRGATRPWAWFLVGAVATLGAFAFAVQHRPAEGLSPGFLPHAAPAPAVRIPLRPPLSPSAPPAPRTFRIAGPTRAVAGDFITTTGTLPPNVEGIITAEARWGSGPWLTLATTQSVGGGYRLRYQLSRPGTVHVRIALPDGDFAATVITVDPATPAT